MKSIKNNRVLAVASAIPLIFMLAACGEKDDSAQPAPGTNQEDEGNGEYAFGTDRDQIAYSIEQAFSSDNGKAHWEGDRLILSVDGDATATMAGFTQCRVLAQLLLETDSYSVSFPNGQIACESFN